MQEKNLTELKVDEVATIKELRGGCCFQQKMRIFGFKKDDKICVISKQLFCGPIVINLLNTLRSQIAIGRGMASKIIVNTET